MDKTQQYQCEILARQLVAGEYNSAVIMRWIAVGEDRLPFLDDIVWC